jgi:hypothetical protein
MDEVHPSLQGDPPLPPQLLHRKPKCIRGSFVVRHPSRTRKQRLVKILCQLSTIFVHHSPHGPYHAAESAVLNRSRQVKPLVHDTSFSHFSRMASRKKCKFRIGQMRAYDIEKRQALVAVQLESGIKWLASFQRTVTCKVNKLMMMKPSMTVAGVAAFEMRLVTSVSRA